MTEGPYLRKIIGLALPLMIGSVFQQLYSVVDTAIAGKFIGVEALAALGSCDWFLWLILGIVLGMTESVAILIAQRYGAKDHEGMLKAFSTAILMSSGLAVIALVLVQLFVKAFLKLIRVPENVVGLAETYLRIFFAGIPVMTAYNLFSSSLRAIGNGRSPLFAMIIASLVNIILDLLFVTVFHWGVAGCAVATVLAQLTAALFCFVSLKNSGFLILGEKLPKPDRESLGRMFRLGAPIAAQNAVISLGGIAVQYIINGFGYLFLASYTATNKLYGILEMAAISYGSAMTAFVGQNLGAKRMDRVRHGVHLTVLVSLGTSLVITLGMLVFGKSVISLFVDKDSPYTAEIISTAYLYLQIMCIPLSILYILHIYRASLQGLGNTLVPMISGLAELTMRVGSAYILSRYIGSSAVFYAEPLAWFGADCILILAYYLTYRRWKKRLQMSEEVPAE